MVAFVLALFLTWPVHAAAGAFFSIPAILLNHKRLRWERRDYLTFVVPWLAWLVVFAFGPRAASLSSAIVEVILLGGVAGLGLLPLIYLSRRFSLPAMRPWLLAVLCVVAVLIWACFPFLGE